MQIDFSEITYDAVWYDFDTGEKIDAPAEKGVFLKIRQHPASMADTTFMPNGSMILSGRDQFEKFNYCLEDWKGIVDKSGKELPCSADVKRKVFDFKLGGIADFVMLKILRFEKAKEDSEKN